MAKGAPTDGDLTNRKFLRLGLNALWVSRITEHPAREGKCSTLQSSMSAAARLSSGLLNSKQDPLVVNDLDMAIRARTSA